MTTTLAQPSPSPSVAPRRDRSRVARRAISRWAWRLLRREWRQQLLILGLLAVAVAATTVGLGLVVNVQPSDQALLGTATTRIDIADPGAQVGADIAAARKQFGTVDAIEHQSVAVPGSVTPIDLRAQDPHGRYGAPMLRLVSGHYPSDAGQVAMTASVAALFSVHVGSDWTATGRTLRVVGIVENPKDFADQFALVAPGRLTSASGLTLLLDSNASVTRFHPPGGSLQGIMSDGSTNAQQRRVQALAVLLLATIGLVFIGLLAAAGFTVMAHRRQRALGMIAAIGASDRQVRRVMLANGAAAGTVGSLAGAGAGLVVWFAFRPAFEHLVGHRIDPLSLPWWAVLAGVLLAILTAIGASWWPARTAARLPIVAALSGRPAPPQPAHRFALLGAGLAALGFVLLVVAHGERPVLIVSGIVATAAGVLLLAPVGIRILAIAARRAPVALRLALRDLARYQARSGAALAAASLAIGIAVTIAVSAAGQQAADHSLSEGNLPANQLIAWLNGDPNGGGGGIPMGGGAAVAAPGQAAPSQPSSAEIANARKAASAIAQALGARRAVELDIAANPSAGAAQDQQQASLLHPFTDNSHRHGWTFLTTPYVATPSLLDLYGIPAVGAGTDVISARTDLSGAVVTSADSRDYQPVTVQVSHRLPRYTSAPNTLITPRALHALGFTAQPAGWLIQTTHPLTGAQITAARYRAAASGITAAPRGSVAAGITIETRSAGSDNAQQLRDYATLIGGLVALGVLAMTVGLIRSETANDLRTLAATGAGSGTRRTLTAATAAALALLGAILGTLGAYLALIAWHWRHIGYLSHPPYANLALILVGLPLVALAGGWLFGRTPASIARRPLE